MAADCEILASGAGEIPWLMTEIQGGNNVYSGFNALCPTQEEIKQWLWVILGSGGKGGIFWSLNARASGFEAGEWALLDFQNHPSDRLLAAAEVSNRIHKIHHFSQNQDPLKPPFMFSISENHCGLKNECKRTAPIMRAVKLAV